MDLHPRYEMLEKIGAGSFATVYRAHDDELRREVAIKQIHEHYLDETEQLDRYWREAQLLASLHHPNIVTIFDIDRERGWLIMELMQANLGQRMAGRPMDLKSLRTAVAQVLRALKYLHARGIVHGDIKPSNMMIDARRRIKLGDFGLARRVSDKDGSLLKGTTKYMAPEVVSNEFGEVGPISDCYSLGFSAYELMCGSNFESLFPGLDAFGRDKQIAWMMWHGAADRKLPEIHRVLEGVPDDLAHVVQMLTQKKQSDRYHSVDEALSDLNADVKIVKAVDIGDEESEDSNIDADARKRRLLVIGAFSVSLILSLIMLIFFDGSGEPENQPATREVEPTTGIVGEVLLKERVLIIDQGHELGQKEIDLGNSPLIWLNEKTKILARNLQAGDRVTIRKSQGEGGRPRVEVFALRPDVSRGSVKSLQPQIDNLTVAIEEGSDRGELPLTVSDETRISVNGQPARLAELKVDDLVTVRHVPNSGTFSGRVATAIEALQKKKLQGIVRDVNSEHLTIGVRKGADEVLSVLPFAQTCNVTVNAKQVMDERLLKPIDLRPGDRVTVFHHAEIFDVGAIRQLYYVGSVQEMRDSSKTFVVGTAGNERKVFIFSQSCQIAINGTPAEFSALRRGDHVELMYERSERGNELSDILATRPVNKSRLTIIIGNQNYDDNNLTPLPYTLDDAQLVYDTLIGRYGCSPDQTLFLKDATRVRLEQAIPTWLQKAASNSQVIVYFVGHAYLDSKQGAFLAAKDFSLNRMVESGISLGWLRDQLERCVAEEKLLLLDCCHAGEGQDLKKQPATAELIKSLKLSKEPAIFTSTTAIASCQFRQRGLTLVDEQHGAFAYYLAEGFSGQGDKNQDVHLEPTELFDFLNTAMVKVTVEEKRQLPAIFIPDNTPPPPVRLTAEAKYAIRDLIGNNWSRSKLPSDIEEKFFVAEKLVGSEPDAKLAFATLLLKTRKRKDARRYYELVKVEWANVLLSYEGLAWIHFEDESYIDGVNNLVLLCSKIAEKFKETDELDAQDRKLLVFAGRLRDFATGAADLSRRLSKPAVAKLDALVKQINPEAEKFYQQGRNEVAVGIANFDKRIKNATSSAKVKILQLNRKRIARYTSFDFESARQTLLNGLKE